MKLWLCLRFGQLPLQCLNRSEHKAVVVLARQRVFRTNECAAALGIREQMSTATLRTLAGDEPVLLLERDPQAERRCLQNLCCWAYGISPTLHTWREDCLQVEIGGCLNLFKGLDAILTAVGSGLRSRGFTASPGLAATPGAAWLLSFAEPDIAQAIDRPLEARLAPLPLRLLDDFTATVDSLHRAGLETLGDVLALPTQAISRRCGIEFSHFLQRVLGQRDDPRADYEPPTTFSDGYWYGYEVKANVELLPAAEQLLQSLCRFLRNAQLQTAAIDWQLTGVDRRVTGIAVRSASRHSDWRSWLQLTRIRFEQLKLDTGVEGLNLECRELQAGQLDNMDLFDRGNQSEPLESLLDRLRSRLGMQAIEKIAGRDEHLPELAVHTGTEPGGSSGPDDAGAQRPFWLLQEPQPLHCRGPLLFWRGDNWQRELRLGYGPERIEDNWWREPVSRDYYVARCDNGQQYWVFRDRLQQRWYVHGVFP